MEIKGHLIPEVVANGIAKVAQGAVQEAKDNIRYGAPELRVLTAVNTGLLISAAVEGSPGMVGIAALGEVVFFAAQSALRRLSPHQE